MAANTAQETAGDTAEATAERLDVRSADGTSIAVWVDGVGAPLVLVHGALSDHTTYTALVDELRPDVTTFAVDRRGRGASGDGAGDYDIEREFEDVAAVVDAVAARTGEAVTLWGHSYGADCAMGGAARTANVAALVLYEPGLQVAIAPDAIDAVDAAVADGRREDAARLLLVDIVEMTDEELGLLRSRPVWPSRLEILPTVPRELRAETGWVYRPGQFAGVTAPTVLLAGSDSPPIQQEATRRAAAAIAGSEIRVLDGHGHIAHQTDPALVAGVLREIVRA
jgi:pimeloyl-ACP methyl ester carboxylesterase